MLQEHRDHNKAAAAATSPSVENLQAPYTPAVPQQVQSMKSSSFLREHFTEIRDVNGNNIFHCAASSGSVECIDFLCQVAITDSTQEQKQTANADPNKTIEKERN